MPLSSRPGIVTRFGGLADQIGAMIGSARFRGVVIFFPLGFHGKVEV